METLEIIISNSAYAISAVLELTSIICIAIGFTSALFLLFQAKKMRYSPLYNRVRLKFGGWLVLALEFQLASDILKTSVSPTFDHLIQLGAIAAIRTFLNYFLNREMKEEEELIKQKYVKSQPLLYLLWKEKINMSILKETIPQTSNEQPVSNLNNELAKERTSMAYDRTMMAWVRTALALIGFGVGIFEFTQKTGGNTIFRSSQLVGLLLIILGVLSMFGAIRENKLNQQRLNNPEIKFIPKTSLAIKVGYALIAIGIISFIHVISKIFGQGF